MKSASSTWVWCVLAWLLGLSLAPVSSAATRYVNLNNPTPAPPYLSWDTAAQTIQEAIDVAVAGDEVLVTNGVYATGGRAVRGSMTNRIVLTNSIVVRSLNGPAVTVLKGAAARNGRNGDEAIRCGHLGQGAVLSGFTLTNGYTRQVQDMYSVYESSGGALWCEASGAVSNCLFTANSAVTGGAVYSGQLYDCVLAGNSAQKGGASYGTFLRNCIVTNNSAMDGGGSYQSALYNCTVVGNVARRAGQGTGGGGCFCRFYNCSLSGNSAQWGGGAAFGTLSQCTLTDNSASLWGGGVYSADLTNCIVSFNTAAAGDNHHESSLTCCCTTPLPLDGWGNIDANPLLASSSCLSAGSPCRGVGNPQSATGSDVDGEAWRNPPSSGCDEYYPGAVTGALQVAISAAYTKVAVGFEVKFRAVMAGRATLNVWDFGGGMVVSNQLHVSHAWGEPGDYAVVLRVYNDSQLQGVCATQVVQVLPQPVYYVAVTSSTPNPPYTSWANAARQIQEAVDAATLPGALVLAANGTYASGGQFGFNGGEGSRVVVNKPLIVRSVNGPSFTVIQGHQVSSGVPGDAPLRCAYLVEGAILSGFTLTGGTTANWGDGGGVYCSSSAATLSNCVLLANSAGEGGGVFGGTLINCILRGNLAIWGGGAFRSTLKDCLLMSNSAEDGGGSYASSLSNCTVAVNGASSDGGGAYKALLKHCAVTNNRASYWGGGASRSRLDGCIVTLNSAGIGGGADQSLLNNCLVSSNSANTDGGGVWYSTLYSCALTGNSAGGNGGGAFRSTLSGCTVVRNAATNWSGGAEGGALTNCIVYFNTRKDGASWVTDNWFASGLNYSCTTPLPMYGTGNIADVPLFVDFMGGNLRLQSNSPCINRGLSGAVLGDTDLDGRPRMVGGRVDMGAYEFQGAGVAEFIPWLQRYGLPTDGSADFQDFDGDRMSNWQEWQSRTDPTNGVSVLRLLSLQRAGANMVVRWQGVSGARYVLQCSTNLLGTPDFLPVAANIPGQSGTLTYMHTNGVNAGPLFYRVEVEP